MKQSATANAPVIRLPLVSVVITNFNYGRFVEQAIRSVAAQNYDEWECIVVDDRSTDNSIEVIEQTFAALDDQRFQLLRLARNSGQMAGMKAGVEIATGAFVVFLDADDMLLPDFLNMHVSAHLCDAFSAGVTASDVVLIDENGRGFHGTYATHRRSRGTPIAPNIYSRQGFGRVRVASGIEVELPNEPELLLVDRAENGWHVVATSALMFRRDILPLVLPDRTDGFRTCADVMVYKLSHLLAGTIAIGATLSCYRLHGKNGFSRNPAIGGLFMLGPFLETNPELDRLAVEHITQQRSRLEGIVGRDVVEQALAAFGYRSADAVPPSKARLRRPRKLIREIARPFRQLGAAFANGRLTGRSIRRG